MSYNQAILNNPDIDSGAQLARRSAEGIEDIYFRETSGDLTVPEDHPGEVDLTDEVTRRVDPTQLPLDPIGEHESYKLVDGKNYRVAYEDVGGGKRVPYLQEVIARGHYSDTKMALIGGKLYEIEFEKDPETKRIRTYLTSSVGDLFQNDRFLQGQTPAQKLELLGKIRKSATFITWYDSGEYNRWHRQKYEGEASPELDPGKVRSYAFDSECRKLEGELKKKVGTPAAPGPGPGVIHDLAAARSSGNFLGLSMLFYFDRAAELKDYAAARAAAPEAVKPVARRPRRPS